MPSIKSLTNNSSLDIIQLIPASFSCILRNLDIWNEPQIKLKYGPQLMFYNSPLSSRVTPKIAWSCCTIAAAVWTSDLLTSPTWKLNLPYFILPKKKCNQETLKIYKIYSMRYEVLIAMNISVYSPNGICQQMVWQIKIWMTCCHTFRYLWSACTFLSIYVVSYSKDHTN